MNDAEIYRSTPGHVYGVACHSSTTVPAPPPTCPCPCHANAIPPQAGVYCPECRRAKMACLGPGEETVVFTHEDALAAPLDTREWFVAGPPDYYYITKGNTLSDELHEHFKTMEKAEARAKELNDEDRITALKLTKAGEARVRRLKELCCDEWSWATDSPAWAHKCDRYAVLYCYDSDSFWSTEDDLAEIRTAIEGGEVEQVIDLDSGGEVAFRRTVTVELG